MDALEALRIGWRSIRDHRLRSALTTLGVVIGIAAVVTFVTLGASLEADIVRTIAGENTDVVHVSTTSEAESGIPGGGPNRPLVFTAHDAGQLRQLDGVEAVVPEGTIPTSVIAHGNDSVGGQAVTATTGDYFGAQGIEFVEGRPFEAGQREVVLDRRAAGMFATNASVGDTVTITLAATGEEVNATVVGIVERADPDRQSAIPARSRPAIYAPPDPFYEVTVTSPSTATRQRVYPRLLVVAADVRATEEVRDRVLAYLDERSDARQLKPAGSQFDVTTFEQLVDQIRQVTRTFTAYITSVAVIALVVGAIGIANIMLVSVTERTREIGIMKAVGARRRDVLELFLIESTLLGLFGAVLGAVVGLVGAVLATRVVGLPFQFRPAWLVVAVVVGMLVGIVAGLYPAWNAARIDPIEALRRE